MSIPIAIVSDAPTTYSGLGRITREVAQLIHENLGGTFRVATIGISGTTSRHLPFQQYPVTIIQDWKLPELPKIWKDFAGDDHGIILTIWNAAWVGWFAMPELLSDELYPELKAFLMSGRFERWCYMPVDGCGPDGKLHPSLGKIIKRFDRILAYTKFGSEAIERTLEPEDETEPHIKVPHLPHGTDGSVFYPRDRTEARRVFVEKIVPPNKGIVADNVFLLGVIATNTLRKDWPLAFAICRELCNRGVNVGLWAHTDRHQKDWDLFDLANRSGMQQRVMFSTSHLSNEDLAWGYAACNATLAIGRGEGWGFPIAESAAMGIPCLHVDYAGGAEIDPVIKIPPVAFESEGYFHVMRPLTDPNAWADVLQEIQKSPEKFPSMLNPDYYWDACWLRWQDWLLDGAWEVREKFNP